jgi:hypothetical protein
MWLVGYAPGACLRGWLMELGHHSTEVAHGENGDVQEGLFDLRAGRSKPHRESELALTSVWAQFVDSDSERRYELT